MEIAQADPPASSSLPHQHPHHDHPPHHEKERSLLRKALGLYGNKDVPPERVAGSVCVCTGANSGVGFETCAALCRAGAGGIFCLGRDPEALRAACAELERIALASAKERVDKAAQALPPGAAAAVSAISSPALSATEIFPIVCDLESAGEVARAAFSIEARAAHVDILLLCAGRYVDEPFRLAAGWGPHGKGGQPAGPEDDDDEEQGAAATKKKEWGVESTMAANYYGHALLASMLIPKLLLRAQDMLSQGALHLRPVAAAAPPDRAATTMTTKKKAATEMAAPPAAASFPASASPPHKPIAAVTGTSAAAQRYGAPAGQGPAPLRLPQGSQPLARARVVWVSSATEVAAPAIGPALLEDPTGEQLGTGGMAAYSRSKLMGVLFVRELARRLALGEAKHEAAHEAALIGRDDRRAKSPGPRPVDVIALHPGVVASPLMGKTSPRRYPLTALLSRAGAALVGLSPRQAAGCVLYAATSPELDGKGGLMVGPGYLTNLLGATPTERALHPDARDPDAWGACWESTSRVLFRQFGRSGGRVDSRLHAVLCGGSRALPARA